MTFSRYGIIFLILLSTAFAAQTLFYSCDFSVNSCGFNAGVVQGGALNVSSTTSVNVNASSYTWFNLSFAYYPYTGGLGFKVRLPDDGARWFIDGTDWKNEPVYSVSRGTVTLDNWNTVYIETNKTLNQSKICTPAGCSTTGVSIFNSSQTDNLLKFETTYAGVAPFIDNVTVHLLDTEYTPPVPPTNWTLLDHSGNGRNLTNNNAEWLGNGNGFNFNGYSSWINTNFIFNTSVGSTTICLDSTFAGTFKNHSSSAMSRGYIISGYPGGAPEWSIVLNNDTSNNWYYSTINRNSTTTLSTRVYKTKPVNTEKLCIVLDRNIGKHSIYVNGIFRNSTNLAGGIITPTTTTKIGAGHPTGDINVQGFWNGTINNVRLYNTSLTAAEVLAINNSYNVACDNLVAWYPFTSYKQTCDSTISIQTNNYEPVVYTNQTALKTFSFNVSCFGANCGNLSVYLDPFPTPNRTYLPNTTTVSGYTYAQWIDIFNDAIWNDTVSNDFKTGGGLAAVRWYTTEGSYNGYKGELNLNSGAGSCPILNATLNQFCVVTDEHGNVQLTHSYGSNQWRYEQLHNFSVLLRNVTAGGNQCWKSYVNGNGTYATNDGVCKSGDSASDATLRIMDAMGIACAKQRSGVWINGSVDYCQDWTIQAESHIGAEVAYSGGRYILCNGRNNALGCPTAAQSFRPDYYELKPIFDYATATQNSTWETYALDALYGYNLSLGTNLIPRGKTGLWNSAMTTYSCHELCTPAYIDNVDAWRTIPALSQAWQVHNETMQPYAAIFNHWFNTFGGGTYNASDTKPFEIYGDTANGTVKQFDSSYKTTGMWIPINCAYNTASCNSTISRFVTNQWDTSEAMPYASAYAGAYFFTFVVRGFAAGIGAHDIFTYDSFSPTNKGIVSTTPGALPVWTTSMNPQSCILNDGETCTLTWVTNWTGTVGVNYTTYAFATFNSVHYESERFTTFISGPPDYSAPNLTSRTITESYQQINATLVFNEPVNLSITGIATTQYATFNNTYSLIFSNLSAATTYNLNLTFCDTSANCNTNHTIVATLGDKPTISISSVVTNNSAVITLTFNRASNLSVTSPTGLYSSAYNTTAILTYSPLIPSTTYTLTISQFCDVYGLCDSASTTFRTLTPQPATDCTVWGFVPLIILITIIASAVGFLVVSGGNFDVTTFVFLLIGIIILITLGIGIAVQLAPLGC